MSRCNEKALQKQDSASLRREQYHKDFAERQLRKQKLQEFINQEKSPYERTKMRLRNFCAWLLYRD